MPKVQTTTVTGVKGFFSSQLQEIISKRGTSIDEPSFEYLVNLLAGYMESEKYFHRSNDGSLNENTVAFIYAKSLEGDAEQKKTYLKRLGDVCLMIAGVFPESVRRKLVDIDYYLGMGGTAYGTLSSLHLSKMTRELFESLSRKYTEVASILGELSERQGLQSDSDILALYERWLATGDERLKALLIEKGITATAKVKISQ